LPLDVVAIPLGIVVVTITGWTVASGLREPTGWNARIRAAIQLVSEVSRM
jgi:hypothetical protein